MISLKQVEKSSKINKDAVNASNIKKMAHIIMQINEDENTDLIKLIVQ